MTSRGAWVAGWMWLACAMTALLMWRAYQVGYDDELGSRAGAEPVSAGLLVAGPFFVLGVVELFAATGVSLWRDRTARLLCLAGASATALLVLWLVAWSGQDVPERTSWFMVRMGLWLLAPLALAWVALLRDRAREARSTTPSPVLVDQ